MIELGQTTITKRISNDFEIIRSGDHTKGQASLRFNFNIVDENGQVIEILRVMLTGEEYNQFYTDWTSDQDVFEILKEKGLIPNEVQIPEGDLLNIISTTQEEI
jgi:hypothetical protein